MQLYPVAFLFAGILLANVEQTSSFELTTGIYPPVIIHSLVDLQNGVAHKRLLRRYDDEERTIGVGTILEFTTKIKGSVSKVAKSFVDINKYEAQVANKLKLGELEATLTRWNLEQLTKDIQRLNSKNIIKKVSVIGTLTARYGDDALAKALVAAEEKAKSQVLARPFQALRKEQLTRWQEGGNSADDVFNLLKLRDDGYRVIVSEKFEVLDDYVKFINTKNSDQTSLYSTLITGFGGEDKLGALLQTAMTHRSTMKKAKELENSLIIKWADEGQLPTKVFHWLHLDDNVDDAFTAVNLKKVMKYVETAKLDDPIYKKSVIELYTNSFGEAVVAKKLASAWADPPRRLIATKLRAQQVEGWINSGKSVDDMFVMLKIQTDKHIAQWQLDALGRFIQRKNGEENLIKILSEKFGGTSNLATILERASKSTKATTLQKKQFATWMDDRVEPDKIMPNVLKTSVESATDEQKAIATKFREFYNFIRRERLFG